MIGTGDASGPESKLRPLTNAESLVLSNPIHKLSLIQYVNFV